MCSSFSHYGFARLVMLADTLEILSIKDMQSAHERVSDAQVVVMVLQSSAKLTFAVFAREVVGLEVFTRAIYLLPW